MQTPYPPPPAPSLSQCVTRVQLNISCRNLRDKDVMSKSDPMAVVMIFKDGNWFEVNCARKFGSLSILRTCLCVYSISCLFRENALFIFLYQLNYRLIYLV